ncbi:hypothetical protein [Streptomyces sp. NPDC018833]|uniref:hypothetical protein n=1 Tax=Streptomyces sp. NPDC018833 TaxID=3365053 RepID=UPI0037B3DA00
MYAMRRALSAGAAAVVLMVGSGAGARAVADTGHGGVEAGGGAGVVSGAVAPEADVAHHGHVSLHGGRFEISLKSGNHGPSGLDDVTVKLEFSLRAVGELRLPERCLWAGERVVLCATGPLRADGAGRTTILRLRTAGDPPELVVKIRTVWNGGATDRNPANNEHRVIVPATGDPYVF